MPNGRLPLSPLTGRLPASRRSGRPAPRPRLVRASRRTRWPALHPFVDPRGQRFGAAVTSVVLAVVLLTRAWWLLAIQAVVFAIGASTRGGSRTASLFRYLVRPRLGAPAELEAAAPPQFAQLVGLVFAAVGVAGFLAGVAGGGAGRDRLRAGGGPAQRGVRLLPRLRDPPAPRPRSRAPVGPRFVTPEPAILACNPYQQGRNNPMSRSDVLVDADWVEAHLDDPKVVLVEVDEDVSAYDKGHIRGAVRVDWKQDLQDPVRRDFVNKEQFEALLSARGIANDDTVVLYGGNNNWFAAYAYWYFKIYGHEDVKLLDGGRKKWELDSRSVTDEPSTRRGDAYTAQEARTDIRAFRDEVIAAIGVQNLVDVRSPDEFSGKLLATGAPAAGAVAGRRSRPRRQEHPVVQGGQRGRHLPLGRRAQDAVRRAGVDLTAARTPSPTAASASAARTRGSCCTRSSTCRTSRTTTARGPSTARWSASRSRRAPESCARHLSADVSVEGIDVSKETVIQGS